VSYALGVDLGTTASAAAVFAEGRVETVTLAGRATVVPTVVLVDGDDPAAWLVGEDALTAAADRPDQLARWFKRDLGRDDPLVIGGRAVRPEALLARVLASIIDRVMTVRGAPPSHVTLTHPAQWGRHRTALLRVVADAAGLVDAGLLPEPDAAAISFAGARFVPAGSTVVVYDLGGGTFDVSVLRKTADAFELVGEPLGVDRLGGIDIDERLGAFVLARAESGLPDGPARPSARQLHALELAVTAAKERLSSDPATTVSVACGESARALRVTRDELERMAIDLVDETLDVVEQALDRARIDLRDVHGVLLVGGASRMPLVASRVQDRLGVLPLTDGHAKHCVCIGAAITAAAVAGHVVTRSAPPARTTPPALDVPSRPAVSLAIDVERQGLTGAADTPLLSVPMHPAVTPLRRIVVRPQVPVIEQDQELERIDHSERVRRTTLVAVAVAAAILVLVAILSLLG
jgi:molecular chaperone DnaK